MADRIHLSKADVTALEEEFVLDALRSGWIAPLGPHVDAFEREIAERVGVGGALALSSGTAALHLALLGVGAGSGRTVLVPTMTFAASVNAVCYTGASPVFIDATLSDGNVDPHLLLEALDTLIDEGVDVCAVMSVDLFGRSVDYSQFETALADRGVPLIEDAAEALGASLAGRQAGSFGVAAALSFNGNKIMTTSGGGMLLSDDLEFLERSRYLSTQARQPVPWYEHTEVGFNYRMSNILAALGRGQLARLDSMIGTRRRHRDHYRNAFSGLESVTLLGHTEDRDDSEDNCWLTCITLDPNAVDVPPSDVIARLNDLEIEARHLWKPMHLQPLFSKCRVFESGASAQLFNNGVTLPSGSRLSDDEIDRVISGVLSAVGVST